MFYEYVYIIVIDVFSDFWDFVKKILQIIQTLFYARSQ